MNPAGFSDPQAGHVTRSLYRDPGEAVARACVGRGAGYTPLRADTPAKASRVVHGQMISPRSSRYQIRERLGAGASGVVYRAYDPETERDVAVKMLRHHDPEDLYLLKHEFRALADIVHPNLARLYDLEVNEDDCFFTMELVPGRDLISHLCGTASEPCRDYARLTAVFLQLVLGLDALHARGKFHRDVKPMNVLVEQSGRVVLLDFGLVVGGDRSLSVASQREGFAGTLLYTSPEQAWGMPISPVADFYSVGVVLYEALTGKLPFEGPNLGALLDRRNRAPAPPRSLVPAIPEHLAELALDLLSYEPERRPGAAEIRARLQSRAEAGTAPRAALRTRAAAFVGREDERSALRAAFETARAGTAHAVRIEGPSGIGKTALLERFLGELEQREDVVVLRSRCHPHETVRFEAIDGLVDELSRFLIHERPERLETLRPRGLAALVRVFPVLGRVPFERYASDPDWRDADPQEIRRRGFAALRELLARFADRQPLVLWIDDLHWGDLDSAPILRELLRPPDAPRLLMLLSYRSDERERGALLRALGDAEREGAIPRADLVSLEPLSETESRALIADLLASSPPDLVARAESLVTEAHGSPFFVEELARFLERQSDTTSLVGRGIALEDVFAERLQPLPQFAREILELVAASGGPIETRLVLELAGVGGRGRPGVYDLCNGSLLRTTSAGDQLEAYHGRIREAVLERLPLERRRQRHRQLATALATLPGADPSEVLQQYLGADDATAAAPWALVAAEGADQALAFARAAELYELAWRLRGGVDADWSLLESRAGAFAHSGRGEQAAGSYVAAAEAAERATGAGTVPLVLRGRAIEQYFNGAELERGLALLPPVLHELGAPYPRSPHAAQRKALALRLRFVLRGTRFRERPAAAIPAEELARLDVLYGVARGASMLDHTLSDALTVCHLLQVLRVGDPSRVLRALGLEAAMESNSAFAWMQRRSDRLLARVETLAQRTRDPYDLAWLDFVRCTMAFNRGLWTECVERGVRAIEALSALPFGKRWHVPACRQFLLSAQLQLGRLREVAAEIPTLLADARERGDRFALTICLTGDRVVVWLAADDSESALRDLAESGQEYREGLFSSFHFGHLYAAVHVYLYRDEPWEAWRRVDASWGPVLDAGFLALDCVGNGLRHMRARAALAAAVAGPPPAELARFTPQSLATLAEREARSIARSRLPHAPALTAAVRAGVAGVRGDASELERQLELAVTAFGACGMKLNQESARWQLGALRGDEAGRALCAEAELWMKSEGVLRPERIAAMAVPIGRG